MRSISRRTSTDPTPSKRTILRRWLDRLGERDNRSVKRGRLMLESLESRQLLAGDVEFLFTDGMQPVDDSQATQTASSLKTTSQAEGELAPDLVAFAKALGDAGVTYYGAAWCPACTVQKEIFQDGGHDLPFVEVTGPDRSLNDIGVAEGIEEFPTWDFPDGTRETGVLSLQTLSAISGVEIPQSETPSFQPIGDQTVANGSPLHIPVDVYDPDGGLQTVTVEIDRPDLLTAEVLSGNRSIRIDMQGYGDMVFEMFEQRAPRASGRVIELAEADFYDDIIFHRVINQFVIQAGDPTGTGSSGSTLGTFDDDFHPDLQHNRTGVLSYAKAGDDTNNSQFFITEVPTPHLDFNHSIIGQLVEGEDVREAISNRQTNGGVPTESITMDTIDVFNDLENSVVMFKPTGAGTGAANVTFTVTDPDGNAFSETVTIDVVADNTNGQPFLNDITVPTSFPTNLPAEIQLSSTDVEGDAVTYFVSLQSGNATAVVNPTTGLLTVTPDNGFVGEVAVKVGVEPGPGVVGNATSDEDTQVLRLNFEGEQVDTPSALDLLTGSDSGSSNIDNVTNLESLTFSVDGVTDGATVEITLVSTGAVLGFATASGDSVTITSNNIAALGDGSYEIVARQTANGQTSDASTPITIVYDSTSPASVVDSALTRANVGVEYRSDLFSSEEGSGLAYAISSGPSGAAINSATGVISWTPTESQVGQQTFTIELTDLAGNSRTESFNVEAAGEPLIAIKLQLTDLNGNEISTAQVGQEFLLNFIGVDTRNAFDRSGVFAAFADILFDSTLVRPVPGAAIDYASDFPAVNSGTFLTGLIDELGAATAQTVASNETESLIATVRLEAIGSGSLNFLSEPADAELSEMLLFGVDEEISDAFVEYRTASLAIGQNFVVGDDDVSVAEDSGSTTLDVLANDDVVQGSSTLSVVSVTQPSSGGTVALQGGEVIFTPDDDFNGELVFTYRVSDTTGAQEDGTVTVTVTAVNDPPTGESDRFDVDENSTANRLEVLANDSDAPDTGETLTITKIDNQSAGATVTIEPGGQLIRYTPPTDFSGTDSFTYTVSDGELETDVEVVVTVAPADPPPTARDDAFDVDEDADEAEFDLLSNDERDDSDEPFVLESAQANEGGTVRISDDGTQFFYAPTPNFFGSEEVVYTIRDSGGGLATATATFTVAPSNDAPPVSSPTATVNRGSGETVVLKISDLPDNVDGNGETLTFANLGTSSAGGTFRIDDVSGDILYTPPSDSFVGPDSVSFEVKDDTDPNLSSNGTITIDVTDLIPRDIFLEELDNLRLIEGIKLIGTDALGHEIEPMALQYSTDGSPSFNNVLPGEYSIEIPAIPFLLNGAEPQSIPVVSLVDDGDTTVTPQLGRLRPEFISMRGWFGSAPRQSILAAVGLGSQSVLAAPSPSAEKVSDPVVTLDDSGDSLTVTGTDPTDGSNVTATVSINGGGLVRKLGERGGLQLLKINIEDVDFTPVDTTAPAPDPAPEGELISAATSNLTVGSGAEGELIAPTAIENVPDDEALVTSVDAAMQDVAEELTLISPTADALAEASNQRSGLDDLAVDAALSEQL